MKKLNYTIAMSVVMTAAMAACSSQEELDINNGSEIELRAAVGHGTRATETTIQNFSEFKVYAEGTSSENNFNEVYKRQEGGSSWAPAASQHYWPKDNSTLKFYAYAPSPLAFSTKEGKFCSDFTIGTDIAEQADFIVAYNSGNKAQNGAKGVQLTFKHMLSQIEIKAKSSSAVYQYTVAGWRIGSVKNKGTFSFQEQTAAPGAWQLNENDFSDYTDTDESNSQVLAAEAVTLMTESGGTAMLLPQQLTAWDTENDKSNTNKGSFLGVYINIKIIDGENKVQYYPAAAAEGETQAQYGWACIPVDTNWKPGYKYIYTLDFSNGAGKYPPENPDVPGEDILTDPIRFTVDVEPWINDEGDHNMNM